jgi:hypothetical protein
MGAAAGGMGSTSTGMGTSTDIGESNFTGSVAGWGNNILENRILPDPSRGGATTCLVGNSRALPFSRHRLCRLERRIRPWKVTHQLLAATTMVLESPFSAGNNGVFTGSVGTLDSEGMGVGMGTDADASSTGGGNTFGSSALIVNSIFGIAGGTASGAANGTSGTDGMPDVLGNFGLNGTSFNNLGYGFIGAGSLGGGPVAPGSSPTLRDA